MTRNDCIMAIEKRISELLEIIKATKGLTDEGLPKRENTIAMHEWRILKKASTELQAIKD